MNTKTKADNTMIVFDNARFIDVAKRKVRDGTSIAIEGDRIREVSSKPITLKGAHHFDLKGKSVLPGLIDAHCHVTIVDAHMRDMEQMPLTLTTARSSRLLTEILARGFTTVRDTGGAEWGLKQAQADGLFAGPRLLVSGRPLTQTGGHGDQRHRTESFLACACTSGLGLHAVIADGVPDVQKAAREELRQGVDQIKIMVSGGVVSPYDPLESVQYTQEELRAIVHEAKAWGRYATAHAYSAKAISHAVAAGVRCIEHGNLIDAKAAGELAKSKGFMVPTLAAYEALHMHGDQMGLSESQKEKARVVRDQGMKSVEIASKAGVSLGFGSDLLGRYHHMQSLEFSIRSQIQSMWDVLASATLVNAEILNMAGEIGVIAPGAYADIIVIDGDPMKDVNMLQEQGRHMPVIMQNGQFYKNTLR
jgi:imidazolonepropionase-like amidohydrolase